MTLIFIVIGALATGIVAGWIYAGFRLPRLGFPARSRRLRDMPGEGVSSGARGSGSPLARVFGAIIGVRAISLGLVGAVVPAALLMSISASAGAQTVPRCLGQPATKVGTARHDFIRGTEGRDVIVGLAGNDTLNGLGGNDLLCGGDGADDIEGSTGRDRLFGGAGRDSLSGDDGDDRLEGGDDGDRANGGMGRDSVSGGEGADGLFGHFGDDELLGEVGNDFLQGDSPDRSRDPLPRGDDRLDGGPGADTAGFWADPDAPRGVAVDLSRGMATGDGTDRLLRIEGAFAESIHADVMRGDAGPNVFSAARGEDEFIGAGGNDLFIADPGNDSYRGDGGRDTIDFRRNFRGVVVSLHSGSARGLGTDTLVGVENATGGSGNDILSGSDGPNRLHGREGEDNIRGGGGDDTLLGGLNPLDHPDQVDRLSGGAGDDRIDGGAPGDVDFRGNVLDGRDEVDFAPAPQGVTVDLSAGTAVGDGNDVLVRVEDVLGSGHDDVIDGSDGPNEINASAGNDTVDAGGGDDEIEGNAGDDAFAGGAGTDVLEFNFSAVPVNVNLTPGVATGQGSDTVEGVEDLRGTIFDDVLVGDEGPNAIVGNLGDDELDGGPGDDFLNGQRGSDELRGDLGNDNVLGTTGNDDLSGNDGDDRLRGGRGIDAHTGGAGNDVMFDDGGNDSFTGDAGVDLASFQFLPVALVIDLPAGTVTSDTTQETISTVEDVVATEQSDEVIGDSADNTIRGLRGLDRLLGGPGDDLVQGGRGHDAMHGGDGVDMASYEDADRPVTVDLLAGFAEGFGSDTLVAIEDVTGSAFSDYLRGDSGRNVLMGLRSDDTLEGRGGDDLLDGGDQVDAGDGGDGTDTCVTLEIATSCEA